MVETPTIQWPGASGETYKYWIYSAGASLKAEGGNYIFARETSPGQFTPVYIGETSDLSERFDDHHKADCINSAGATHIHAHLNSKKQNRLNEEGDLIAQWKPSCND